MEIFECRQNIYFQSYPKIILYKFCNFILISRDKVILYYYCENNLY